jgi:hypothetical protein
VSVTEEGGSSAPVTGAVNSYSPEFSITPADTTLLDLLSEATGGRPIVVAGDEAGSVNLFERRTTKTRPHDIWETLFVIALILLPIDVGIRRVHITREQLERAKEWVAGKLRSRRVIESDPESAAALAQLKGARSRVRLGEEGAVVSEENRPPAQEPAAPALRPVAAATTVRRETARDSKPASVAAATESADPTPLASRLLDARRNKRDS